MGDLVGRQQSALATDQTDQGWTGALADAEGGEFGVQAGAFASPTTAGACHRPAVKGGEIKDQAAEQTHREGACLGLRRALEAWATFF